MDVLDGADGRNTRAALLLRRGLEDAVGLVAFN